jgi:hypothetical protein
MQTKLSSCDALQMVSYYYKNTFRLKLPTSMLPIVVLLFDLTVAYGMEIHGTFLSGADIMEFFYL